MPRGDGTGPPDRTGSERWPDDGQPARSRPRRQLCLSQLRGKGTSQTGDALLCGELSKMRQ